VPQPAAIHPPAEVAEPTAADRRREAAGRAPVLDPVPPYRHDLIRPRYLERDRTPSVQQPAEAPVGADPDRREWEDGRGQDRQDPATPPAPAAP
jgi:hypothetical protein